MATAHSSTLAKGLRLMRALASDAGRSTLAEVAKREGIPLPTAHRLALTLESEGYLVRYGKGSFLSGGELSRLGALPQSEAQAVAARLRRPLAGLARRHQALVHFGVFEDGMVTYLVKANGGKEDLFTAEMMQLEAYCSAIGKVVLSALPDSQLDAYLEAGPFIAITPNTITDPGAIRGELDRVRREGIAFDRYEIREDLYCFAVPVADSKGKILGGLSISFLGEPPGEAEFRSLVRALKRLARGAGRSFVPETGQRR